MFSEGTALNLFRIFAPLRNRVTTEYSRARQPDLHRIAIVYIGVLDSESSKILERLISYMSCIYSESQMYLRFFMGKNVNQSAVLSKLHVENLHIRCGFFSEDAVPESEPFDLSIYVHTDRSCPLPTNTKMEQLLGTPNCRTPRVNISTVGIPIDETSNAFVDSMMKQGVGQDANELYTFLSRGNEHYQPCLWFSLEEELGFLFDEKMLCAPLSEDHYCHSYLVDLVDQHLKDLILSMFLDPQNISAGELLKVSINVGDSFSPLQQKDFLSMVLRDETGKNVVVVFKGVLSLPATQVCKLVEELNSKDYSYLNIFSCHGDSSPQLLFRKELEGTSGRYFTVICALYLGDTDMRSLQLASERIMVSREFDLVDAYAARCKLLKIDHTNWRPGTFSRHADFADAVDVSAGFNSREFKLITQANQGILESGELPLPSKTFWEGFLAFCDRVTVTRHFIPMLDAAIKQAVWTHKHPSLIDKECEALDLKTQCLPSIVSYLEYVTNSHEKTSKGPFIQKEIIVDCSPLKEALFPGSDEDVPSTSEDPSDDHPSDLEDS